MRAVRLIAILWVVLFAMDVSVARAGEIILVSDPVGPGCPTLGSCGAGDFTTGNANNDDFTGAGNPNLFGVTLDFRSVNYIDVLFTVKDSNLTPLPLGTPGTVNGITEYAGTNFSINNVSGVNWTGFTWTIFPGIVPSSIAGDELDFDFAIQNPLPTSHVDPTSVNFANALTPNEDEIDYMNGLLKSGDTATFFFSIDVPDTCGSPLAACTSFTLRGTPTGPQAASEPSALLLLGSGLAGLGLWRRWHA
jgi:hypothetical protein